MVPMGPEMGLCPPAPQYYSTIDVGTEDVMYRAAQSHRSRRLVVLFVGTGALLLCLAGLTSPDPALRLHRWTTFEAEVSKGTNMAQTIFEVGEYSKRWHAQLTGKAFPGVWKLGLSRETGQPITQHAELAVREGMAAVKLSLTKTAGSLVSMMLKSNVEASNEYTYGGALGSRFQPVVFAANVGTREGDLSANAGFVTDGNQYKLRAGLEGKQDASKWKLELQSGTRHRPLIWKASVTTDQPIDMQRKYRPEYGVQLTPKQMAKPKRKKYNTYTYMGEEESFPPEYAPPS